MIYSKIIITNGGSDGFYTLCGNVEMIIKGHLHILVRDDFSDNKMY